MNQMADLVKGFAGKAEMPTSTSPAPRRARPQLGQHADQAGARLGAADDAKEGLGITYKWIEEQVGKYGADTKASPRRPSSARR